MNQLDIDYQNLVRDILENGSTKSDRTGTGTISVFGRTIRHSFKDGKFPLLTTKKMAWKTMVTELLWFLRGDTNIKYLVDNGCHIWDGDAYANYLKKRTTANKDNIRVPHTLKNGMTGQISRPYTKEEFINKIKTDDEFAKKWGELGPVYGKQWRRWGPAMRDIIPLETGSYIYKGPIDQIANAIHLLKTDPDSRRILVNSWNTGEIHEMVLPPCHYSFQFYTRELTWDERHELAEKVYQIDDTDDVLDELNIPKRAISLIYNARSQDVPLGTPFNIPSYSLLLMMVAKQVNMVPEEVIANMGDCHIYLNQIEGIEQQLTRIPYDLPTLKISDRVVNDISEYTLEDFTLENYVHHPAIKLPLSN